MTVYYTMLGALCLFGAALCVKNRGRLKDAAFLAVAFLVLAGVSALRYDVGYDYSYVYAPVYESFLTDTTGEIMANHRFEPGFKLLLRLVMLCSDDYQALFAVTGAVTVGLVLLFYRLYSPNPFLSVFLFVALSQFYCSLNFIRQTLAAAVAMYAFPRLLRRDIPGAAGYFAAALLAASFHQSALLLVPFYFINLIPIDKYVLIAYGAVTAAVYVNSRRIIALVTRFWYTGYSPDNQHMLTGFPPWFAAASAVIFLIVFFALKDTVDRLYVNYAFFAFFFALMGTRHSILDRLSIPFAMLSPVALAVAARALAENKSRRGLSVRRAVLAAIAIGGLAVHHCALALDGHGVSRYRTVLSQPFYGKFTVNRQAPGEPARVTLEELYG